MGLHATRRVDGVTPEVVAELAPADDSRDDRTAVDPDAYRQRQPALGRAPGHGGLHLQGHLGHRFGMVHPGNRQPPGHHVRVTDRLDLLEAVAFGELVEGREHAVQEHHDVARRETFGQRGEVDQIGEQHAHLGEAVRDHLG